MAAIALHSPLFTPRLAAQSSAAISTVAGTGTGGYRASDDGAAATAAQLNAPAGVAADGSGNLYIADKDNNRIRKVDASTGNISTFAGGGSALGDGGAATAAQLDQPEAAALDGSGNLYIADTQEDRIRKVDASTGNISTVAGGGSSFFGIGDGGPATSAYVNEPVGVIADGSGNLYIAVSRGHRIRKVDTAGVITTIAGTGTGGFSGDGAAAASAQLNTPYGAALDGSGNLYIVDGNNNRIRKVDTAGVITTIAGGGSALGDGGPATSAQLNNPADAALDAAGNLYIADFGNHRIRKIDTAGVITTIAGTGAGGFSGDGGAPAEAQLNGPFGVALDGAGNLYIADRNNNRIRKVTFPTPPAPLEPAAPPEFSAPAAPEPEPEAQPVGVSELSFAPGADSSAPAPQTLTLRAEGGAVDFQALPSARWIEVSPADGAVAQWRGRLAEGETITLRVTVNPQGLRPGTHRGRLYIRAGGRVTAAIRIVLEVPPPTGPAVTENGGVFNAARMSAYGEPGLFGPRLLPLAPGAAVIVQGVHFASGERMEASGYPLPTMLGGARVLIDGAAVPLMAVGPQRIEAQLPWALGGEAVAAGGLVLASVVVESGGESSWPRRFWVGPYAPGVFTVSGAGQGQALATFAGTTDLAAPLGFSAGSRPARAGDVLEIYATGLGAVEPPLADGMNSCAPDGVCLEDGSNAVLRHTAARPRVWIGAYAVSPENVRFSGLAPDMAGVNLVIVEIPRNLVPSNAAELRLAAAGRISQSGATIAVE